MKCPVCKTECGEQTVCPECGFDQLDPVFVNKDDAATWMQTVVVPFREEYWIQKKSEFIIRNGILEKYSGQDTTVEVPYGVTVIGKEAFSSNQLLEHVILPATTKEIQREAFSCCENLVEAVLNEGLEVIRFSAFECCDLLSVTLPDSVIHLEEGFCLGGASILVKETNPHYEVIGECLIDRRTETLLHCWSDDFRIHIPKGIKRVGKWAFPLIENERRRVRLPDGVESIGFIGRGIQVLYIPSSVTSIDEGALHEVSRLHISSDNDYFYCETGCVIERSTSTVIAAESRTREYITIPSGVNTIGRYAFDCCKKLRKIVIPASVNHIQYSAFSLCDNLEGLYFEHETAGSTWESWWNLCLQAKCYWKGSWHYEPMANE